MERLPKASVVNPEQISLQEEAPREDLHEGGEGSWLTIKELSGKLGAGRYKVKRIAEEYRADHPDWFEPKKRPRGQVYEHYSPDLVREIEKRISEVDIAPDDWLTQNILADDLGVADSTLKKAADGYREKHPEWFKNFKIRNPRGMPLAEREHYAPELIKILTDKFSEQERAPEGWATATAVASELGGKPDAIRKLADAYRESHPDWLRMYKPKSGGPKGGTTEFYAPELISEVRGALAEREDAPEGWLTANALSIQIGVQPMVIFDNIESYRETNPEWFERYKNLNNQFREHLSPQLIDIVREKFARYEKADNSWATADALSKSLGVSRQRVGRLADQYRDSHAEWFSFRKKERGAPSEHYSPELIDAITHVVQEGQAEKESIEQVREAEIQFENLLTEINEEKSFRAEQFKHLVALFGSHNAADLLYTLHPEFHNIPIARFKGSMADYLGEFLLMPGPFSVAHLENPGLLLKNENLRDGLREVIKRDCLQKYLAAKRGSEDVSEQGFFAEYFSGLAEAIKSHGSEELEETVQEAQDYYLSLLERQRLPDNLIESLRPDRPFPDIYQQINIKEVADKKRLLIADEMGVGKSASAILAKEALGVSRALIVAPSNTVSTWEKYLSDQVGADGKQVGYFKPGQSPKVLSIESPDDLRALGTSDCDYILISHEKLNESYVKELQQCGYQMLIVDEVHKLKNVQEGVRASALLELSSQIQGDDNYLALLSGTPVPNHVEDVAMLLKLLHPEQFAKQDSAMLTSSIIHGNLLELRSLLMPYMQMKSLGEHIEMPQLTESMIFNELSPAETEIYQMLLDEDELTPAEKIRVLRQFLLNPDLLEVTPAVESSKIASLNNELLAAFETKDKVVLFVNDYVTGVIRGDMSILDKLAVPPEVQVRIIHGEIEKAERDVIQEEFNSSTGKMLLIVSGRTADVGIDYTGGEHISFYNEPWTKADKDQQQARVFRPGVTHDMSSNTLVTRNTIEEGIHHYIEAKYRAVEKLLKGIPITELEQDLLVASEKQPEMDLEVNAELANYYFSSFDKLNKIFASVKQMGEKDFYAFLERYGGDYAECYEELGSRSYQGNASRVCATLIEQMVDEERKDRPRILDIASGPEMLKRHSDESMQPNVVSIDINLHHFLNKDTNAAVVGSFSRLPFAEESFDYVNLSLALHYSKFVPSRGEYERARVMTEMNRVLRQGGRAVVNMIYSLDFKNDESFVKIADKCGMRVVEQYTGEAVAEGHYSSHVITLEKVRKVEQPIETIMGNLDPSELDGLKLKKTDAKLKDSRHIIPRFMLGDKEFEIKFNSQDQAILEEEKGILAVGEALKEHYGTIADIPKEEVVSTGFTRVNLGNRYILFKPLTGGGGVVLK